MKDYLAIHRDGVESLPWAKQIDEQYDNVDHFITHFGFGEQPLLWNSEVFFGGRFTLSMTVLVNVDYKKRTVTAAGAPNFFLVAAKAVHVFPGGGIQRDSDTSLDRKFDQRKWDEFVSSGYDLAVLDIPPAAQKPVANFDKLAQAVRAARVPITKD
jgi:hypothetical protein